MILKDLLWLWVMIMLISCQKQQQTNVMDMEVTNVIQIEERLNNEITSIPIRATYDNSWVTIRTYGVEKIRIQKIVNTINTKYFTGLNEISVIYSNPNINIDNKRAIYIPDSQSMTLWIYDEGNEYVRYLLLHELKHHYCYTHNQSWSTVEEAHQKCFLSTPIDIEYGFIK